MNEDFSSPIEANTQNQSQPHTTFNSPLSNDFDEGVKLFDEQNYIEAIEIFSYLSKQGNPLALQYLGRCYYLLERYQIAYRHFQQLEKSSEAKYSNYATSMIATIEMMLGNYNIAIEKLAFLKPSPRNRFNLSLAYWKKYKVTKDKTLLVDALNILDKFKPVETYPLKTRNTYHLKALIYQAYQEFDLANEYYLKALSMTDIDKNRGIILNDYASFYIDQNMFAEAENLLHESRSLIINISPIETNINDKWFEILEAKRRKITNTAADILTTKPNLETAIKLFDQGHIIEAIENLLLVLSDGENETARKYLAQCYFKLEKNDLAIKHFTILTTSTKEKNYAISMLSTIALTQEKYQEAIKLLNQLPPTSINLVNIAITYWQHFKAKGGEWLLHEAVKALRTIDLHSTPTHFLWRIHITFGIIFQAQKEYRLAEDHYKLALRNTDSHIARGKILNEYSLLYIQLGKLDDAENILNQAKELIQDHSPMDAGFNAKYRGLIYKKRRDYKSAKEQLQFASTKFKEQNLFHELAEVSHTLVELNNPNLNFYEMAGYFADGLLFEKKYQETNIYDAKAVDFIISSLESSDQT